MVNRPIPDELFETIFGNYMIGCYATCSDRKVKIFTHHPMVIVEEKAALILPRSSVKMIYLRTNLANLMIIINIFKLYKYQNFQTIVKLQINARNIFYNFP